MAAAIVPIMAAVAPSIIQLVETLLHKATGKQKLDAAATMTHTVTTTLANAGVIPQSAVPTISAATDLVQTTFDDMKASGKLVTPEVPVPPVAEMQSQLNSAQPPAEPARNIASPETSGVQMQPSGIAVGSITIAPTPAPLTIRSAQFRAELKNAIQYVSDAEVNSPGVIQALIRAVTQ